MNKLNLIYFLFILTAFAVSVAAQSGGQFQIEKSVISAGGGQAVGGQFILDETIGEPVAGTTSSGGGFSLASGFWGGGVAVASNFTVSGRVLTSDGRGLRNATVSMTSSQGVVRTATTSSFGLFSFDNVIAGDTYTVRIISRLYRYQPQAVQATDNITLPDFVGLE